MFLTQNIINKVIRYVVLVPSSRVYLISLNCTHPSYTTEYLTNGKKNVNLVGLLAILQNLPILPSKTVTDPKL